MPRSEEGGKRGGKHGESADDGQDAHDGKQDGHVVAALAGGLSDDDRINAGLDEVKADQESDGEG